MDDIRRPAQLFHRLQYAAGEEDGPFPIVREEFAVRIPVNLLAAEIIFIVDEIDLYTGGRDGGHLDDERTVYVAHDDVHAGKPDDFVQLVLPFVDAAIAGHEGADFLVALLDALGKFAAQLGDRGFRKVRKHLCVDEQNLCGISHSKNI